MYMYLMINHLSIFVFGVNSIKKPVYYSGIKFIVDQNNIFKDKFEIICDSFNDICNLNIDIMSEDISKYCVDSFSLI